MENKIVVEFDKKNLNYLCAKHCMWYELCQQTDIGMIKYVLKHLSEIKFKIKEQNNEKNKRRNK